MQNQTYTKRKKNSERTPEPALPLYIPLSVFPKGTSRASVSGVRTLTNLSDTRRIHCHNYLEIGYCLSGSGLYYIRGEIYPVGQGDVVIVYPGEAHDGCNLYADSSTWRFFFADTNALLAGLPDYAHLQQLTDMTRCRGHFCSPAEKKRVLPLLQRIFDLYDECSASEEPGTGGGYKTAAENHPYLPVLVAGILYETEPFMPADRTVVPEASAEMQRLVLPAVSYMMNHYASPVRMEELCALCYCSEGHLRRVFTAVFGVPPTEFLHKIRIRHACAALTGTDTSVLAIAGQCGYASLSSFNRQFQKIMQMSPSAYRQSYGKYAR